MKNRYFICLKLNNLLIMKSLWNISKKIKPTNILYESKKNMSTHLLTTSSLLMVQEGSRSLKEAASVKSEWQSLSGKICPSCWKIEKAQNLLALSSFVWDNVQFQTHLQQWLSESLWKCLPDSGACDTLSPALQQRSNVHLLHRTASVSEMHRSCRSQGILWHCSSPSCSDYATCKDPRFPPLFKVENTLKYHWTLILYSLFQIWNHPWLASELLLWV